MRARLRAIALLGTLAACLGVVASCSGDDHKADAAAKHPPVVMVMLDEFSTLSLLDDKGRIDAVRYPNFAQVAQEGSWFPNATASLDETGRAIRSLMVGRTLTAYAKPSHKSHPRNLFTALGRSYRVHADEEASDFCPKRLCPKVRAKTGADIRKKLANGRGERFLRWVRSIAPSSKPTLYFEHTLLPHGPWNYLPSGRSFHDGKAKQAFSWKLFHFNRWLVNQSYQRHLLQTGFTDLLLGKLFARLRATGLYDKSLIVVTADNGESFGRLGNGHEINSKNVSDIALTPLFVKQPGQTKGEIVARHVRTIDVLPTIVKLAGVRLRWRVEGRSVFGNSARKIPSSTVGIMRNGHRIRLSLSELKRRTKSALRTKLRLFGSDDNPPGLFGVGPFPALHNTPLSRWRRLAPGTTRAKVDLASAYRNVRLRSGTVPVKVSGSLTGKGSSRAIDVAVALDGTIRATGPTLGPRRGGRRYFSIVLPESAFHDGANKLELFEIVRAGGKQQLRPLTP